MRLSDAMRQERYGRIGNISIAIYTNGLKSDDVVSVYLSVGVVRAANLDPEQDRVDLKTYLAQDNSVMCVIQAVDEGGWKLCPRGNGAGIRFIYKPNFPFLDRRDRRSKPTGIVPINNKTVYVQEGYVEFEIPRLMRPDYVTE